jgi:hypothetical protein
MLTKNTPANLALIILILLIVSCQKGTNDELPAATDRVKTYTEQITSSGLGNSVTTYNLNYDANNRITSMVSATNPGDKIVYTYPSDNTVISELYIGNVLGIHHETYNKDNHLDSTFQYNDSGDSSTERHIFNASGDWIKTYEYEYSTITGAMLTNTTTYTYDANGNQTKAEDTDTNVETFEYYTDKVYIQPLIGPALIPNIKRNLMKSHRLTSNGYEVGVGNFTYAFDNNDRISTITETTNDGSVVVKTFTYF